MTRVAHHRSRARAVEFVVRGLVLAALTIDAVIHFRLAGNFQLAVPDGIGGGTLFRLHAAAAVLAGILLLLGGRRRAYALACLVLVSGFVAVMLYRYVDVPAIGPIPAMYEPIWYFEKALSAAATGIGAAVAGAGLMLRRDPDHTR